MQIAQIFESSCKVNLHKNNPHKTRAPCKSFFEFWIWIPTYLYISQIDGTANKILI